jgi:molecular chaperone DnaK
VNRTTIDFGISLGNTNSAIAVLKGGCPEVIKGIGGERVTPTAVSYARDGRALVGAKAKSRIIDKPNDAYEEFLRRMGTEYQYGFDESGLKKRPEELAAEILKLLRADVLRVTGEDIQSAVITVPTAFELPQCDATRRALGLSGFKGSPLLQEPVAALLASESQPHPEKGICLVYDLGGGTFEAALMRTDEGEINLINHAADNFLGGTDIDWAIIEKLIIPKLISSYNLPDFKRANVTGWGEAFRKLKWFAEVAKIELSAAPTTSLSGCSFKDADGREINGGEIVITQDEVIGITEPIIRRSIDICRRVLKEANLPASSVQRAILVGGPTTAPYFQEMLQAGLGIPLDHRVDPLTIVACGAAIFAGTQKIGQRSRPAAKVDEFRVDLTYSPAGNEVEPLISGKVTSPDGSSLEGFVLEFVNAKAHWSSGNIRLPFDGAFMTNLISEKGERNAYLLNLRDANGVTRLTIPDRITYTVGACVEECPLAHPIGLALSDNQVFQVFARGAALPARRTISFRTEKALRHGQAGDELRFPLVEGESSQADRNRQISVLVIPAMKLARDLPAGSEIEVTLKIDESRNIEASAYIPSLDEQFAERVDLKARPSPVQVKAEEEKRFGTHELPGGRIDRVYFSVTSPRCLAPESSFVLQVWAHLERQRQAVIARAREEVGSQEIVIQSKGPVQVARGAVLAVRLRIEGMIVQDPDDTILWKGEIGNASFPVNVPSDAKEGSRAGLAIIYLDGIQIAKIHFVLMVGRMAGPAASDIPVHVKLYRKAFASYASPDRDEVIGRIQGMQKIAPDLDVFLDVVKLRSGEDWEKKLWQVIPQSDVFYLFWSAAAKESPWVEKEWRCALDRRGEEFIDPVPLISPEDVRPPDELSKKHFNDWILAFRRGRPKSS